MLLVRLGVVAALSTAAIACDPGAPVTVFDDTVDDRAGDVGDGEGERDVVDAGEGEGGVGEGEGAAGEGEGDVVVGEGEGEGDVVVGEGEGGVGEGEGDVVVGEGEGDGVGEGEGDGGGAGGVCVDGNYPTPNEGIEEEAGLDGCPAGMARVGGVDVCMDRWEAFLVETDGAGAEVAFSPFENPAGHTVKAKSAFGAVPQGYISGHEAAAACSLAGKRLCSNAEWTRACRGASNSTYPYGNAREPGVCNDARAVHPAVEYFGTSADWIWSELGNGCIDQQHDTVDRAGANAQCVDESGRFFDLMGNLHEWIDDPNGTFRGGYYVDTVINGNGCLYTTTAHDMSHWDYSTGFRCCAD